MTIYAINPNSSEVVTHGIARAVKGRTEMPVICLTTPEGPPGIETDDQVAQAATHISARATALSNARAIVVACFSDPGVADLRRTLTVPVLGIRESAVQCALEVGARFGVIAIGTASIPRHLTAFRALGVINRLAGDRALGLSMPDLADPGKATDAIIATARALRETDGADVLILGCAGMPRYKALVEEATGLPVIEPCQAAVDMAAEQITLAAKRSPDTCSPNPRAASLP